MAHYFDLVTFTFGLRLLDSTCNVRTGVTMLTVLFWMGAMNVATDWLMAVCIMILSFWLLSFNLAIFL